MILEKQISFKLVLVAISMILSGVPHLAKAADIRDDNVRPCVDAYYGIGESVNYKKAYECFRKNQVYEFLILMQLNGEGVPANPKKAQKFMKAWFKTDPYNAGNVDADQVRKAVSAHLASPTAPRTDFCQDLGYTTYSMGFCAGIENELQKQQIDVAMRAIRASFDPDQQVKWDAIQKVADQYAHAEGMRIYKWYENGTIRGIQYDSQVSYVRGNFQELMTEVFAKMSLAPATISENKAIEIEIQAAYKRDIDRYMSEEGYLNDADSSASDKKQHAHDVAEYKAYAADSQRAWETLRDECSTLAAIVYKRKGVDWSISMSVAMGKLRIKEIKNNSINGD